MTLQDVKDCNVLSGLIKDTLNKKYEEWKFEWYLGDQNTFKRS